MRLVSGSPSGRGPGARCARAVLLGVALWLLLAGAGQAKTPLVFWGWPAPSSPAERSFWAQVEKGFESARPQADLQAVFPSTMGDWLFRLLDTERAPDAAIAPVSLARDLQDRGLLQPLNSRLNRLPEVDLGQFFLLARIVAQEDEVIYGIPFSMEAAAILYNPRLFLEAGLDPTPGVCGTWAVFRECALKLTRQDGQGRITRAGFGVALTLYHLLPWLYANAVPFYVEGGRRVGFNRPEAVETLEYLVQLIKDGQVVPPGPGDALASGRLAMRFGTTAEVATLARTYTDLELRLTLFPQGPAGRQPATVGWMNLLVVPKGARQVGLATEFIAALAGRKGQEDRWEAVGRPDSPRPDFYQRQAWQELAAARPYLGDIPQVLAAAGPFPFIAYEGINGVFGPLLRRVVEGELGPAAALARAERLAQRVLEEWHAGIRLP